jgi:hypothetical protein
MAICDHTIVEQGIQLDLRDKLPPTRAGRHGPQHRDDIRPQNDKVKPLQAPESFDSAAVS